MCSVWHQVPALHPLLHGGGGLHGEHAHAPQGQRALQDLRHGQSSHAASLWSQILLRGRLPVTFLALLSKLEHCKDHVIYISMLLMPKEQHVSIAGRLFQSLYII